MINVVETYRYTPYGKTRIYDASGTEISGSAIGNPYMFTARRMDAESGLYYYRARMYAPEIGRFLQTDPLGYIDSMNLYAYCGNNPTNFIDPWGERNLNKCPPSGNGTVNDPYIITYQDIMDTMENEIDRLNDHGFFSWDTFNFDNDYFHEEHNQDSFCIKGQGMYTGHDINYMVVGAKAGRNISLGLANTFLHAYAIIEHERWVTQEEHYFFNLGYMIGAEMQPAKPWLDRKIISRETFGL